MTLGVRDLARARRFYEEGLGWTRDGGEDDIAFYQLNGLVLGLYDGRSSRPTRRRSDGSGFRGVSLAYCVREREDLERVLAEAEAAGATISCARATPSGAAATATLPIPTDISGKSNGIRISRSPSAAST